MFFNYVLILALQRSPHIMDAFILGNGYGAQNVIKAVCILQDANILGIGMNPIILPLAMDK